MPIVTPVTSSTRSRSKQKHFFQELFVPPMVHHGMERCGVDQLHLVFLNMFKHLFKCTVHEGLPDMRKQLVPNYLKTAGFYSYDAPSVDEDPTAHWIGREVKRLCASSRSPTSTSPSCSRSPPRRLTSAWR